jgi:lysophospholipid acyltransferase (LPLAT)-like uncharacterized protein
VIENLLPPGLSALVRTLRYDWVGAPLPDRAIATFWHSKMIAGWWMSRKNAVALVSKSKDGDYLTSVLKKWKYSVVRGSSGKEGMKALSEAMQLVKDHKAGRLIITPDGPQGPREVFKRGMFIAAAELDLPLYFLDVSYSTSKTFADSWDKFEVPMPLSKVTIVSHHLDIHGFPESKDAQNDFLIEVSRRFQSKLTDELH